MKENKRTALEIIILTIILSFAIAGFYMRKEYNYILNSIMVYSIYLFFIYFEYKRNLKIQNYIRILVLATALIHNIFGQYFHLYKTTKWFDKALHVFGTFSFTLLSYSIIKLFSRILEESKVIAFIIIISIGITLGAFLENIEFALDKVMKTNNQHGMNDINYDLIFNVLGAALAGIFVMLSKNDSPSTK